MNPLTPEQLHRAKQLGYIPLFADRDTLQDALDYGYAVAKASDAPAHVTTALHVLLNTVAKLYTLREEKEKQA